MDPFNIKLRYGRNELTLTILPAEEGIFKIIYYGAILGAVIKQDHDWDLIPYDELSAGDLPFYTPNSEDERVEIELNEQIADRIGEEIDLHLEEE